MAYKIKQERVNCEDLEIELADGSAKTYHPVLSTDTAVKEYRELVNNLSKIDFDKFDNNGYEDIGKVVIQFLNILFDEEQTIDIVKTFNGKYVELLSALFPYIEDVVKPYIEKLDNERKNYYKKAIDETL